MNPFRVQCFQERIPTKYKITIINTKKYDNNMTIILYNNYNKIKLHRI